MFFRLDIRKTIEAVGTLLRLDPHRIMGRKRLLAMLYLADRECLKRTGRPIIGGRLAALPFGPIHSEVYDLIKGGHHTGQPEWSNHFAVNGRFVLMTLDPGVSALSRYEIGVLSELSDRFMACDDWDIAEETERLPEYVGTYSKGSSTPITLEQMIEATGQSNKREAILRDAEEKSYFDDMFAGTK
jgi:hypothetical protein